MEDIVVSTFTFDDDPNESIKTLPPAAALGRRPLPFTGKGTNYEKA